jgi:hypothetical protein
VGYFCEPLRFFNSYGIITNELITKRNQGKTGVFAVEMSA